MFDFYDRIGGLVGVWGVNECLQLCFFLFVDLVMKVAVELQKVRASG